MCPSSLASQAASENPRKLIIYFRQTLLDVFTTLENTKNDKKWANWSMAKKYLSKAIIDAVEEVLEVYYWDPSQSFRKEEYARQYTEWLDEDGYIFALQHADNLAYEINEYKREAYRGGFEAISRRLSGHFEAGPDAISRGDP